MLTDFTALGAELARVSNQRRVGRVTAVGTAALEIAGLSSHARIGDQVAIALRPAAASSAARSSASPSRSPAR